MRWIRRGAPAYARFREIIRRLAQMGRACGHKAYRYLQLKYEPTIHDRWIGYGLICLLILWHLLWFGAGALLF